MLSKKKERKRMKEKIWTMKRKMIWIT